MKTPDCLSHSPTTPHQEGIFHEVCQNRHFCICQKSTHFEISKRNTPQVPQRTQLSSSICRRCLGHGKPQEHCQGGVPHLQRFDGRCYCVSCVSGVVGLCGDTYVGPRLELRFDIFEIEYDMVCQLVCFDGVRIGEFGEKTMVVRR